MAIHTKISKQKAALCVRLFFIFTLFAHSGFSFHQGPNSKNPFDYYLNLQFDSCYIAANERRDESLSIYLESLMEATQVFLADKDKLYQSKKNFEAGLLQKVASSACDAQTKAFLQSEIKMHWAILKMKYGDEFAAFWSMRQAYRLTKKNLEQYPTFLPSQKTMGMLYTLFGVVPDNYQWVLTLFGVEGDIEKGLELLEIISKSQLNYALESGIIVALLNTYLLDNPEAGLPIISKLREEKQLLLVDYAYSLIAMKDAQSELALQVLTPLTAQNDRASKLPQLNYLQAEIHLQKGEYESAIRSFQQFLRYQQGLSLVKDAYYKIGLCYMLSGHAHLADSCFDKALEIGWTKNEADEYAQSQVRQRDFSDVDLYKLRFATDGGYYENALQIQSGINPNQLQARDRCEFYYRSARLAQKTGKMTEALDYYLKTLDAQKGDPWYFAPNAALQLGMIYLAENNPGKSREYLKKVFDYKNHPYQKSIRQKARTLLKSIASP